MFKNLVLLGFLTSSLCAGKLSNEELKNKFFCNNTPTGVSAWSSSLLKSKQIHNNSGIKSEYIKSILGDDLTWEVDSNSKLIIDLKKIDAGEYAEDDIVCYEVQKIENKDNGKVLSLKDQTLTTQTQFFTLLFGEPLGSKKDARDKKSAEAQKKAEIMAANEIEVARKKQLELENIEKAKVQREIDSAKKIEEEKANNERIAKEQEELQNKISQKQEEKKLQDEKEKNALALWTNFEKKLNIREKYKKEAFTDNELNEILVFLDQVEILFPGIYENKENGHISSARKKVNECFKATGNSRVFTRQMQLKDMIWWFDNQYERYINKQFNK
jgi:hypothetical protein